MTPKTIVSVTPLRVEVDSRTYKQAASIARFGYTSIVVEGQRSDLTEVQLPFALRSLSVQGSEKRCSNKGPDPQVSPCPSVDGNPPRAEEAKSTLGKLVPLWVKKRFVVRVAVTMARLLVRDALLPATQVPKASLYYLHSPYQYAAVLFRTWFNRRPFIYDAHDFYSGIEPKSSKSSAAQRLIGWYFWHLEAACTRRASAVVTVCDGVAKLIKREYGRECVVVRNCHDPRLDQAPERDLRQRLGLRQDALLVVAVGQAKQGAAIAEALAAFRQLPEDIHLAFLGQGFDRYLGSEDSRGLEDRIHSMAPVKPYEVVPFIRSADAALLLYYPRSPNYLNCLPNGFFQSVAAGLPLLYPDLPEISRLARQFDLGIAIDPLKPESIRDGVLALLGDSQRLAQFRESAQAAAKELSWEKEEAILKNLVEQVLASGPQRRA
jgi:glycosyltransferase involved in cell wall biosynthesis